MEAHLHLYLHLYSYLYLYLYSTITIAKEYRIKLLIEDNFNTWIINIYILLYKQKL